MKTDNKTDNKPKTIDELKSSIAELGIKIRADLDAFTPIAGDAYDPNRDKNPTNNPPDNNYLNTMYGLADKLNQQISNVKSYADMAYDYACSTADRLTKHNDPSKHLPIIPSAEHMIRAVKALGLDKQYDVKKKTIYASKGEIVVEASYTKDKE